MTTLVSATYDKVVAQRFAVTNSDYFGVIVRVVSKTYGHIEVDGYNREYEVILYNLVSCIIKRY